MDLRKWQSCQLNSQMKNICLQVLNNLFSTIISRACYTGQGFSIRIILFGRMEVDCQPIYPTLLPRQHAHTASQHAKKQKYVCEYMKIHVSEFKRNSKQHFINLTTTLPNRSNFRSLGNLTCKAPTTIYKIEFQILRCYNANSELLSIFTF